jgi:hypothetical protein
LLEEMTGKAVPEGALFYAETRRRVVVPFNAELRRLAPFAGAWIKTSPAGSRRRSCGVAPFTGAWIETSSARRTSNSAPVARAWIETVRRS